MCSIAHVHGARYSRRFSSDRSVVLLVLPCRFSEAGSSEGSGAISMEPVFSEGGVFSSSLSTSTLAQSFYNKDVLPILGALLSTHLTNFTGSASVGEVQLFQEEIPANLQVRSCTEAHARSNEPKPVGHCHLTPNPDA